MNTPQTGRNRDGGPTERAIRHQRREALQQRIARALDVPLTVLALLMLVLFIVELTVDLSPAWAARLAQAQNVIWLLFIADFAIEFFIAPDKVRYLKNNWLAAISVALPALRSFRLLTAVRVLRGYTLARILTTLNRGIAAAGTIFERGGFGYVLLLTVIVTATAAAGAYFFERDQPDATITSPGQALWWAATIMTTINAQLETTTMEGRVIGLLLRVFAMTISGYVTAIIAVYLLGAPARGESGADELRALREQVARLEALLVQQASSERPHEQSADGRDERAA